MSNINFNTQFNSYKRVLNLSDEQAKKKLLQNNQEEEQKQEQSNNTAIDDTEGSLKALEFEAALAKSCLIVNNGSLNTDNSLKKLGIDLKVDTSQKDAVFKYSISGNKVIIKNTKNCVIDINKITNPNIEIVIYSSCSNVVLNSNVKVKSITNSANGTIINGSSADDKIINQGENVIINAGEGNDTINNKGKNSIINAQEGNDTITNTGTNSMILGGQGNDIINNSGSTSDVYAGKGDDKITNSGNSANIYGEEGNDNIINKGYSANIYGGQGDDVITEKANYRTNIIDGGEGNDTVAKQKNNQIKTIKNIETFNGQTVAGEITIREFMNLDESTRIDNITYDGNSKLTSFVIDDITYLVETDSKGNITKLTGKNSTGKTSETISVSYYSNGNINRKVVKTYHENGLISSFSDISFENDGKTIRSKTEYTKDEKGNYISYLKSNQNTTETREYHPNTNIVKSYNKITKNGEVVTKSISYTKDENNKLTSRTEISNLLNKDSSIRQTTKYNYEYEDGKPVKITNTVSDGNQNVKRSFEKVYNYYKNGNIKEENTNFYNAKNELTQTLTVGHNQKGQIINSTNNLLSENSIVEKNNFAYDKKGRIISYKETSGDITYNITNIVYDENDNIVCFDKTNTKTNETLTYTQISSWYDSDEPATDVINGKYYEDGKLATGEYLGVYYQKGIAYTGINKNDNNKYYENGVVCNGFSQDGKYYEDGIAFSGTASDGNTYKQGICYKNNTKVTDTQNGVYFKNGLAYTGTAYGKYYVKGEIFSGVKDDTLYVDGVAFSGINEDDDLFYSKGKILTGKSSSDNKYYEDGKILTGYSSNGTLYKDGIAFTGTDEKGNTYKNGLCYVDNKTANGTYNGIYFKSGLAFTGVVNDSKNKTVSTYENGIFIKKEFQNTKTIQSDFVYDENNNLVSYLEENQNGEIVEYSDFVYKDGKLYSYNLTDIKDNTKLYIEGEIAEGDVEGKLYKDGVADTTFTGNFENKYYTNGIFDESFTGDAEGKYFQNGIFDTDKNGFHGNKYYLNGVAVEPTEEADTSDGTIIKESYKNAQGKEIAYTYKYIDDETKMAYSEVSYDSITKTQITKNNIEYDEELGLISSYEEAIYDGKKLVSTAQVYVVSYDEDMSINTCIKVTQNGEELFYINGFPANEEYMGVKFVDGKLFEGLDEENIFYQNGVPYSGEIEGEKINNKSETTYYLDGKIYAAAENTYIPDSDLITQSVQKLLDDDGNEVEGKQITTNIEYNKNNQVTNITVTDAQGNTNIQSNIKYNKDGDVISFDELSADGVSTKYRGIEETLNGMQYFKSENDGEFLLYVDGQPYTGYWDKIYDDEKDIVETNKKAKYLYIDGVLQPGITKPKEEKPENNQVENNPNIDTDTNLGTNGIGTNQNINGIEGVENTKPVTKVQRDSVVDGNVWYKFEGKKMLVYKEVSENEACDTVSMTKGSLGTGKWKLLYTYNHDEYWSGDKCTKASVQVPGKLDYSESRYDTGRVGFSFKNYKSGTYMQTLSSVTVHYNDPDKVGYKYSFDGHHYYYSSMDQSTYLLRCDDFYCAYYYKENGSYKEYGHRELAGEPYKYDYTEYKNGTIQASSKHDAEGQPIPVPKPKKPLKFELAKKVVGVNEGKKMLSYAEKVYNKVSKFKDDYTTNGVDLPSLKLDLPDLQKVEERVAILDDLSDQYISYEKGSALDKAINKLYELTGDLSDEDFADELKGLVNSKAFKDAYIQKAIENNLYEAQVLEKTKGTGFVSTLSGSNEAFERLQDKNKEDLKKLMNLASITDDEESFNQYYRHAFGKDYEVNNFSTVADGLSQSAEIKTLSGGIAIAESALKQTAKTAAALALATATSVAGAPVYASIAAQGLLSTGMSYLETGDLNEAAKQGLKTMGYNVLGMGANVANSYVSQSLKSMGVSPVVSTICGWLAEKGVDVTTSYGAANVFGDETTWLSEFVQSLAGDVTGEAISVISSDVRLMSRLRSTLDYNAKTIGIENAKVELDFLTGKPKIYQEINGVKTEIGTGQKIGNDTILELKDGNNASREFKFDENNKLTETTRKEWECDLNNNKTSEIITKTDAEGKTEILDTKCQYDSNNNKTSEIVTKTDAEGKTEISDTKCQYDSKNNKISERIAKTDAEGKTEISDTKCEYDSNNNKTSEIVTKTGTNGKTEISETKCQYDSNNNKLSEQIIKTDANDNKTIKDIKIENNIKTETEHKYNKLGQQVGDTIITKSTSKGSVKEIISLDGKRNVTTIDFEAGTISNMVVDKNGNILEPLISREIKYASGNLTDPDTHIKHAKVWWEFLINPYKNANWTTKEKVISLAKQYAVGLVGNLYLPFSFAAGSLGSPILGIVAMAGADLLTAGRAYSSTYEFEGKTIGGGILIDDTIGNFSIDSKYQGTPQGTHAVFSMLTELVASAMKKGVKTITFEVKNDNVYAKNLYDNRILPLGTCVNDGNETTYYVNLFDEYGCQNTKVLDYITAINNTSCPTNRQEYLEMLQKLPRK